MTAPQETFKLAQDVSGQSLGAAPGSAVTCDMLGCREHATGEVQIGDEYIPLCELHRKAEMDRLTPKWRPLPPHPPNAGTQRPGTPDGSLATETRKPGSLK